MKVLIFPLIALGIAAVYLLADSWWRGLESARVPARQIRALSLGSDLIQTSNSTMLTGAGPEFKADLARILCAPTWRELGSDRRGTIRLVLTNNLRQALDMRLRDEYPSGFRLLSYQRITEPGGSANRSQPVGSGTNRTLPAAGSGG